MTPLRRLCRLRVALVPCPPSGTYAPSLPKVLGQRPSSSSSSSSSASSSSSSADSLSSSSTAPSSTSQHIAQLPPHAADSRNRSLLTSSLWAHRINSRILQLQNERPAASASPDRHRSASDSFVRVSLPFLSDENLLEEYRNPFGSIRVGKILEDLDALAGSVAYLHCSGADLSIVTASVDRIDLVKDIPADRDVSIFGYVTYVGRSSMEVSIEMETIPLDSESSIENDSPLGSLKFTRNKNDKRGELLLSAKFIMVARDPKTNKAAPVPQLRLDTDAERKLFAKGAQNKVAKQLQDQTALSNRPPSVEEMALVHNLYKEYMQYIPSSEGSSDTGRGILPKPDNIVWMKDTLVQNINLTFPQDRNIHNKIFGGYLMRLAYEVASVTGIMFSKSRLVFLSLDDVTFSRPVEIGAVLDLHSQVVYTREDILVVKVVAHVVDAVSGSRDLSNEFWMTFRTPVPPQERRRIMPMGFNECMLYLEGKRRAG
ncbi:Acyl-coenzyme A thioesterase 9, mitochondrial [Entophlyctis sp. JEL0112]|nr:Acyl-coenzyme A thioesterase 9, mitochondrial [Entophlyctis sp. JEL0112]